MDKEGILKLLARRQHDRFFSGRYRARETLGSHIHLFTFQERTLGALALSPSMGPVLYEAGKKVAIYFAKDAREWLRHQPDYRAISKAENAEEANLSGEIKAIQVVYKSNKVGLLSVVEYVRDKLIVVEVCECSDCFDIENIGKAICYSIGGNIAGSLEVALDRQLGFVETKCVAKGDSWCEFKFNILHFDERAK